MKQNQSGCRLWTIGATFVCALAFSTPSFGIVIVEHSGTNNPTSEGFTFVGGLGTFSTGPTNDNGTAAWNITTDPTAFAAYEHNLTPGDLALVTNLSRTFTVRLRILSDEVAGADRNIAADVDFGGTAYVMQFGIDSSGNFVVTPQGWFTYTVPGGTEYHTVRMEDSGDGLFRFSIDGVLQPNPGYTGISGGANRVAFGDFTQTGGSAENVNWAFVQLDVPEPSAAVLLGIGALLFQRRIRRNG